MRRLPALDELMGIAPRRHVQQPPLLPEGAPANNNGSNVIDLPSRGSSGPWNWMDWPKGLPTGQENNPNGFDFGLHPQPANSPTPTEAPISGWIDQGGSTRAVDPFSNADPKFPEGFDPTPGSGQPIQPFDVPGKFGPSDPMIAPMQQTPDWGVIGMLPAIMGAIGQESAPMDQSGWGSGVPSIPWEGTGGAEMPSGQDFTGYPGTQVDPGGYNGGAYGGMGGFDGGGYQGFGQGGGAPSMGGGPGDWNDYFRSDYGTSSGYGFDPGNWGRVGMN